MKFKKHGITIGLDRIDDEFFLAIKAIGTLTHEDYQMLSPLIDTALIKVNEPKIKVLFDATELDGLEWHAVWDDFKLGLAHHGDFDKIALYGSHDWQKWAAKLGRWFVSGEVEYFDNHDDAVAWLKG